MNTASSGDGNDNTFVKLRWGSNDYTLSSGPCCVWGDMNEASLGDGNDNLFVKRHWGGNDNTLSIVGMDNTSLGVTLTKVHRGMVALLGMAMMVLCQAVAWIIPQL